MDVVSLQAPGADAVRLLADIGGTNARFALETGPGQFEQARVLPCADYPHLQAAVEAYLAQTGRPRLRHAAIAIANPVDGDRVRMTNHHWEFSIEATRRALGFETLLVVNDFTALAMSLPHLKTGQYVQIGGGAPQAKGVIGLVGAGTGLGVSGLIPTEDGWISLGSEGGHVSFAPSDPLELAVLQFAQRELGHVSAERLISGPGLALIYRALAAIDGLEAAPLEPAAITELARNAAAGPDNARCAASLRVFSGLLGGMAGNVALTLGALGGVYLGGGVVPKLGELFDQALFRARFEAKGRFASYLARIPTYLITTEHPAFLGVSAILSDELRRRSGESQLLDRIRQLQPTLSQAERRVAAAVLEQARTVVNAPVAEIARLAQVSEPTVIRFCRTLGFAGLPEFKLRLATGMTGTIPVSHSEVELGDTAAQFGVKVMDNTISAMLQARENLNVAALEQAITRLQGAQRVDIYAVGQWAVVAHDAQSKFLRLGLPTLAHTDTYLQKFTAAQLGPDDVMLVLSRTGTPSELLSAVEQAQRAGATVMAITRAGSPLARMADVALETDPHLETHEAYMPMISRIIHLALIDILAVGLSVRQAQGAMMRHDGPSAPRLPLALTAHTELVAPLALDSE